MDEWDVLKAHARAQCVMVKDRLWCEMALALGEVVRRIAIRGGVASPMVRQAWYGIQPRKVQDIADALARTERKAAKAAKQAAREERKRMRRECGGYAKPYKPSFEAFYARHEVQSYARRLRIAREMGSRSPSTNAELRANIRDAELRYAIACAEAGAVPGGRVH